MWAGLDVFSCFVGMTFMGVNLYVWYVFYKKISQQSDQMPFWLAMMAGKFLIIAVLIFYLPKVLSLQLLSLGIGIFIIAFSGICASVGLAKM